MRVQLVLGVIGQLTRFFALAFLPPLALALWEHHWRSAVFFLCAAAAAALFGTAASWRYERPRLFHRSEAMAVVSGTWLVVAAFAAVPFVLYGMDPYAAMFESMSGLTTTGATSLEDFSLYDRPFFLWRSMTQWFGGLGVIALFVVVLPRLGIAGRQLFFAESSSAPGEGVSPQIRSSASKLWALYATLTSLCAVLLVLTGMPAFDAICNSFTTLAAGGFSPNAESIYGYHNPAAEWVLIPFMFLSGASFPLQLKVFTGVDWRGFFKDEEFRFYFLVTLSGSVGVAALLSGGFPSLDTLRAGLFQVASLISSTGFASEDYALWSHAAKQVLVVVMVIGACAGSAGGGPKSIRHLLVGRHVLRELKQVLHPRAILPILYKTRAVPDHVMRAVFTLAVLFVGGYFVGGVVLTLMGYHPITAFTASLACLGNIGPGFQEIGPMGNFAGFSPAAKVILIVEMWVGRLEILTVMALFHPHVWKNLRWR
jgi:trk system potassium uptake protein